MHTTPRHSISTPPARPAQRHFAATSLFGGAILATVATASLAQATYHYFDNSGIMVTVH